MRNMVSLLSLTSKLSLHENVAFSLPQGTYMIIFNYTSLSDLDKEGSTTVNKMSLKKPYYFTRLKTKKICERDACVSEHTY
jgi:hypothetical protein